MKIIINLALLFLIVISVLENHPLIALALVLLFTWRCSAAWLLPLALALDGYFGAFYHVPVISILAVVWFLVSEYTKPRLLVQ